MKCSSRYTFTLRLDILYFWYIHVGYWGSTVSREGPWAILLKVGCSPRFVNLTRSFHDGLSQSPMASNKATMLFSELSSPSDITVRYRYDSGYFDLRRLKAKTKVLEALMRDFLFADDCVVAALNETDFQELASCMSIATKAFWLHHSQTSRSMAQKLNNVECFQYLGRTVTSTGRMDKEVSKRLAKASVSFGRLWTRVWSGLGRHSTY